MVEKARSPLFSSACEADAVALQWQHVVHASLYEVANRTRRYREAVPVRGFQGGAWVGDAVVAHAFGCCNAVYTQDCNDSETLSHLSTEWYQR